MKAFVKRHAASVAAVGLAVLSGTPAFAQTAPSVDYAGLVTGAKTELVNGVPLVLAGIGAIAGIMLLGGAVFRFAKRAAKSS